MCNYKQNNNDNKSRLWIWIVLAIIGVIAAWGLSWWLINKNIDCSIERGTFGDMFGAVNALFSGLAFAGLIVTLLYQKEELKLQREELKETRNELNAQKLEFQEQNKTMKRQRFENTFFNMLSLQQEIVANLSFEYYASPNIRPHNIPEEIFYRGVPKGQFHGREVFEGIYKHAVIEYNGIRYLDGIYKLLSNSGYAIYSNISITTRFDHYFRHLYRIVKYVDSSDLISDDERYEYACIARSQLSDYELVMLFYNCLTANGRAKFKPLIEKYSIFNNLREELLAKREHKKEYSEKAYDRYAE
ncbi:MAG: hypothetical protein E7141_01375 [Rikenellaceae bacterium]|nr:hypothetical protein [Rikenellaceae bacterium]